MLVLANDAPVLIVAVRGAKCNKFTEFTRDGGFMDYITELVRVEFKISKKDSWNPADIWCVQNEQKVIVDVKKAIENGKASSLLELNALMTKFKKINTNENVTAS